jgi:hypothetical protein
VVKDVLVNHNELLDKSEIEAVMREAPGLAVDTSVEIRERMALRRAAFYTLCLKFV